MGKKDTGVAPVTAAPIGIEAVLTQAIAQNVSVETLEKLLGMRKELKAEAAKEAFVAALGLFQEACPIIKKTKKVSNKDGTVRYMFAPLDSIVEQIKKPLKASGLSYRWETKNEDKNIKAICTITHISGHAETSEFSVPIDTEGYMTAPQKYASAQTFAKRYSLCNALGISTGDEDTDATDVKKEKEPVSDKAKVMFLLRELKKPCGTREDTIKSVKSLVSLDLETADLKEVVGRLETLVKENHESSEIR